MARTKAAPTAVTPEEVAEAVSEDTAQLELEKLQKKIAREERRKRREIEATKQKQAKWLLPSLLLGTMLLSWILSRLNFDVDVPATSTSELEVNSEVNVEDIETSQD